DLEMGAPLGELLDRVAAVAEDALAPVDVRDRAARRGRVREGGIVRHHPEIRLLDLDLPQIHLPDDVTLDDVHLVLPPGTIVPDREGILPPASALSHECLRLALLDRRLGVGLCSVEPRSEEPDIIPFVRTPPKAGAES